MQIVLIWILAILFTIDSIFRIFRTNINLGTALMYLITAGLWIYAVFHKQIHAFCAQGVGHVLKIIFLCGCIFLAVLVGFVAVAGYSDKADGNERAVIVLGAGLRGDRVSGLLARRLDAAFGFYQQHPDVLLVVTGGQGPQETRPEADAMAEYLEAKGVPSAQIVIENKSTSTEENFAFARDLLQERNITTDMPVAFATNAFHCYRAEQYAKLAGYSDVDAIPASITFSSIMPCYLREAFAVLYFWVFK